MICVLEAEYTGDDVLYCRFWRAMILMMDDDDLCCVVGPGE